jgi:peptidyl-prolyl cis-trans isomerase B (cyclophilin B)
VLSPILAILVPPAGVVLGHLALPQIRRTGERGWLAAVVGLVLGYLMCAALLAGAIWFASNSHNRSTQATPATTPPPRATPSTSVVTSVAPPSTTPRIKLDLAQATVGTCVEIQIRGGGGDDALDLFKVPCAHRDGVYTVVARVQNDSDCNTTYVAAPPDHTFAVCLNRY